MLPEQIIRQLERDYQHKVTWFGYLSKGDNGSVTYLKFDNGLEICVKAILLSNRSAEHDYTLSRIIYSDQFVVREYHDELNLYFTTPFFNGSDLESLIKKQATPFETRLAIYLKLIQAVKSIHEKGIIHRDLKASNIIVDLRNDQIKVNVIDFGRSVIIFDYRTGKAVATPEDLSLRSTSTPTHNFFHPLWQLVRKSQAQTAPEYTSLLSHLNRYSSEAEGVGLRSDYYALGTLFQQLFPEIRELANDVVRLEGPDRDHAFYALVRSVEGCANANSAEQRRLTRN